MNQLSGVNHPRYARRSVLEARRDRILKWRLALKAEVSDYRKEHVKILSAFTVTSAEIDALCQAAQDKYGKRWDRLGKLNLAVYILASEIGYILD